MPRTMNRLAADQTFCKRTVIVRALRAHREELVAFAHENDRLAIDISGDDATVREIIDANALS